jgi:hypothetical protein
MEALHFLPAIVAMMLYASFEAFVQGFQAMNSEAPETQKVHLVVAPTGSGKTTRFIAEMVRISPDVLFVVCLPRVLACNVAYFLHREYGLDVCVKNGKRKEKPNVHTRVLIMTYQSAANAFVSGQINKFAGERQVSLIFDECHETCAQATILFAVMTALFVKKPKFLHSLICVSATMDAEELSKRLCGVDPSQIQVSEIEAPAKPFKKGETHVIPISVGKFVEDEQEEQEETQQDPFHVMLRNYVSIFESHVGDIIEQSDILLDTSTVVICAGIKSANSIQEQISATLVKERKLPVVIWNTFVQSECPIKDKELPNCHMIILGSHMKLSSSITFPKCGRLILSDVMQVASPNLTNSTTVLNLGIIPKSIELQGIGRGNRDCDTTTYILRIVFPNGFEHPPRQDYPQPEPVSPFMFDFIDSRISGSSAKKAQFLEKYQLSNETATTLFFSYAPIELLLAIHSYSGLEVSRENKKFFKLSINLLRAITHVCVYISNGALPVRRNQETVPNDAEFARLLGLFILDLVNRIIGAPLMRSDREWNTFFQHDVDIQAGVDEIRELILGDGLGRFSFNGKQKTVTSQLLSEVLNFTRQYDPRIALFFMKECGKMYVMKPDEDTGKPTIGAFKFCGPVLIPFGTILTVMGDPLFPMFFLEIPPVVVEKETDELSACGGGSAAPAQVRPSQRFSVAVGDGGSAAIYPPEFIDQFRESYVIEKIKDLINDIPDDTEFTPESFLNPTKYPNRTLPENIRTYQTDLKAVNKTYGFLTFLHELGLMRMNPNGKYQRNF